MIQLLATKYTKHIALLLGFVLYLGWLIPLYGNDGTVKRESKEYLYFFKPDNQAFQPVTGGYNMKPLPATQCERSSQAQQFELPVTIAGDGIEKTDIDGPGQPEMSAFKAAGTSDMVSLFSGDFSYNIPLLDVGGYPVNIFYDGGISMEQSASWVGLGWNINPGNVNRNMRGVPDDFNGDDKIIQRQNMKKNITWGVNLGADLELVGIKKWNAGFSGSVGASLGVSVNNYLGPAIELGIKGTTSLTLGGKSATEKGPVGVSGGMGLNLNSRNGLTFSPSLSARVSLTGTQLSTGVGLSTSYNSRTGIKAMHLSGQVSANYDMVKGRNDDKKIRGTTEGSGSMGANILSSTISFTKPSYVPTMRAVITNSSGAGRFQIGGAMFGVYLSFEIEGYGQVSKIETADQTQFKPMVGYLYAEKAKNNRDAVMDFTRFNDKEVTPSTTIISVPQYSYDVFTIQGEGTGGSIRAYRNDNGYVRDNFTVSKDKSWSAGIDIGIPGHVGGNFNTVKTPSSIGEWNYGNKLRNTTGFGTASEAKENVYFRNPGENSVLHPNQYDSIGGTSLVRFKLGGTRTMPTIEPKLELLNASGVVTGEQYIQRSIGITDREKRTQVTSFLTAKEAKDIGLDKKIKIYDPNTLLIAGNKLNYTEVERNAEFRKDHHISEVTVTEANGRRYVYGLPVYNTTQKDFTFTVSNDCSSCDIVPYLTSDTSINSSHINSGIGGKDGYTQTTETPPYAHSYLLSGLLSPDYVDVHGDGITEDDQGGAIKFNYVKTGIHKWRTPHSTGANANSNPGNLSETKDDKGMISYGERESWYLHSIESKSMLAFFILEERTDGKGASNEGSGINYSDNTMKRLKEIRLYNKADLKAGGIAAAKPLKTVHFSYNYSLCTNTPDNTPGNGKLTLERIWFTYNGQTRANKNQYVFSYTKGTSAVTGENPVYQLNASDRWGNYKPPTDNPQSMMNRDYSYALQDKTKADQYANAWNLKKILLPSGGQIEVEYESDDYAFVQNKRAAVMSGIIGFGDNASGYTGNLYQVNGASITENDYIFIKVSEACVTKQQVYQKYLEGVSQLAVRLKVMMPKGAEFLTSYASVEDYDVFNGAGFPAIWIKMKKVNGVSPLSQTAIEFLRQHLPGQAFPGYDVSDASGIEVMLNMISGLLDGVKSAFKDIPKHLRQQGLAQVVDVNQSFIRLNDPDGVKLGGGLRVKKVMLKDNWNRMTNQYGSIYGQEYNYTTKEIFLGAERTISSGVASYEPSIGGEENPFQSIVQITNEVPMGPASYGAIEMPVLDAFFPAPSVGYSKVTVTSLGKKQNPDTINKKTRSGVGRQVTEFYTAKDFPVYYSHTPLDPATDKTEHVNPTFSFFYKYAMDSRAISQGFLVATNDMHGRMKSQSSYAENDPNTRINYTENFYRNTGTKGFADKFDFVHSNLGGEVIQGNMGIDIELMTDTREFQVRTNGLEVQGQVDWMLPPPFPLWLPFIWPVVSESENTYRAVTTTKVINYHAVLDSIVVIDKGSQVSTKNLVYDAETGQVVVNRTNNEFNKFIYSVNYPAYWAYSGMGLAYKNIDAVYSNVNFTDGRIVSPAIPASAFESGDELYIITPGSSSACTPVMESPSGNIIVWALDLNKNNSSLTNTTPNFIFMDVTGKPYNRHGVKFRIVRSGKRNMLGLPLASFSMMKNPVDPTTHKLTINTNGNVLGSSAGEYKEKWQIDNDAFKKYSMVYNPVTCLMEEVEDCNGYLDNKVNPYTKGLLGNFKGYRTMVFYGEREQTDPTLPTNLPVNGFLANFSPYWNFNASNNMVPDISNTKWVWNTETTRFNSKGAEMETKDALGIYTSAQYGYAKTLPVAISNNSRFGNGFFEGFEDYNYSDLLNNSSYNSCAQKYVDFNGLENGAIVNAPALGINAHTGKQVLQVNGNSTVTKQFSVSGINDSYNLGVTTASPQTPYELGGDSYCDIFPDGIPGSCNTSFSNLGMYSSFNIGWSATEFTYGSEATGLQYVSIPTYGLYTFYLYIRLDLGNAFTGIGIYTINITNVDGSVTFLTHQLDCPAPNWGTFIVNDQTAAWLCGGLYKITTSFTSLFDLNQGGIGFPTSVQGEASYYATPGLTSYKSLTGNPGCVFTKPIPPSYDMMNTNFTIPAANSTWNNKMLFSAWVREANANISNYTNNEVQVYIGGNTTTIKPTGPVIEGWQRYEGYFTVPYGASYAELRLVNNSGSPIYFDDIRIHPFNTNMKSYVYDPINLRLRSELDANNYATFYEYDEEGVLVRIKAETREGIKTITETRSSKQKNITTF